MPLSEDHALFTELRERLLSLGRPSLVPGVPVELPPEELERVSPFAELMFLIMVSDRHDAEEEKTALRGAFRALTGNRFPSSSLERMIEGFTRMLQVQGREARLEAVCSAFANDREDAEGAFSLAAAMSLADGELDDREAELLDQVAQWLGLGKDRAAALLRVERDHERRG